MSGLGARLSTDVSAAIRKRLIAFASKPWTPAEDAAVLLGPPYWIQAKCTGRSLRAVQQRAYDLKRTPRLRARAMEWLNG